MLGFPGGGSALTLPFEQPPSQTLLKGTDVLADRALGQ